MIQKTKRILLIAVLMVVCVLSLVLVACGGVQSTDEQRCRQVYGLYKAYSEEAGFTPLDYNDWLQSVKGADGVSVVGVDSSVEKDENCVCRIVFTYHYSNGTTTQSSVPYLLADGSTLTQHTYGSSWSFDDDYHWHAATCGHGSKDKAAHSWERGAITSDGQYTYTCICGKTKNEAVNVPTEKGKVTYFFTLAEGSPEQGSYTSYWIVGDVTDWAMTPANGAIECKNVEGTEFYYVIADAPAKNADGTYANGYAVTLGYNASSALPDNRLGVNWNYKSDECPVGLDSQHFVYAEGTQVVYLGKQTFGSKMSAPTRVNTTLVVNFKEALPEGAKVAIVGGFNDWNADSSWATIAEDRKSASIELTNVFPLSYEYKIKVFTEYEEGKFWNDENEVPYGVEFVGYEGDNLRVEIVSIDDGEEIVLNNTFDKIGWALVLPSDGSHFVYIY